jgi:hypothetical protein
MTTIDELIAGPDPLKGVSPMNADGAEATALFNRVIASDGPTRKVTHRVRRGAFAGAGIAGIAATVLALSLGNVGVPAQNAAAAVLNKLATNSASVARLQGRYVVMSETDTQADETGELKRTTVIDTQTGASTTYQQAFSMNGVAPSADYTGAPAALTEGPDPSSTEAWFSALPTDPTALSAKLLALAQAQAQTPTLTNDDYIYQEADLLLWSPLVQPTLRSALYQVLASTTGYSINQNATDPAGRTAIAMIRTYSGVSETDTTYEDPSTGAVLAQIWNGAGGDITAVYQPVTSTNAMPSNPYQS